MSVPSTPMSMTQAAFNYLNKHSNEAAIGTIVTFLPLIITGAVVAFLPVRPWLSSLNQHPMAPTTTVGSIIVGIIVFIASIGLARVALSSVNKLSAHNSPPKPVIVVAILLFAFTFALIQLYIVETFQHKNLERGLSILQLAAASLVATLLVFTSVDALAGSLLLPACAYLMCAYRFHTFMMDNNDDILTFQTPKY